MPRLIQMSLARRPMTNLEMATRARKAALEPLQRAWAGKRLYPDKTARLALIKEMLKAAALRVETELALGRHLDSLGQGPKRSLAKGRVTIQVMSTPKTPGMNPARVGWLAREQITTLETPAEVPTLVSPTAVRRMHQMHWVPNPTAIPRLTSPTAMQWMETTTPDQKWWTPEPSSPLAREVIAAQMQELLGREQKIMEMWAETGTPPPKHLSLQPKPTSTPSGTSSSE